MKYWVEVIFGFVTANSLIGYILFYRQKRRQEKLKTKKDEVEFQSEHIDRLESRIQKLEGKVDKLSEYIDNQERVIRAAYKCPTGREDICPVLQKRAELERDKTNM